VLTNHPDRASADLGRKLVRCLALGGSSSHREETPEKPGRFTSCDWSYSTLRNNGYEAVTGFGKRGVVGLIRKGNGLTDMLGIDRDVLPVREASDIDYASVATVSAGPCSWRADWTTI
jgi:hypothetical protein